MASAGQNSKYKPEYDELIVKLAEKHNLYRIAIMFGVCMDTLTEWRHVHPSFSSAYRRAKSVRLARTFETAEENIDNRNYSANTMGMLCKYEHRLSEQREIRIRDLASGTLSDQVRKIFEEIQKGALTADEANKLINALGTVAKIDEVTELRKQVEDLEDKE